ncbi:MAG: MCE family protein [Aeromicrobium sp.]
MLTRIVKGQLIAFVVISSVAIGAIAAFYVKLPQQLGYGQYPLSVRLADAGGLYPKSAVNYRGSQIGEITDIQVPQGGGVLVQARIRRDVQLPENVGAVVRSMSVVGEQYLDMVPPRDASATALRAGATIPESRTSLPTSTNDLLTAVDQLVTDVPQRDLKITVNELATAFDGRGGELGSIIDNGGSLTDAAMGNIGPTRALIRDLQPMLSTQQSLDPKIRSFSNSLESLSHQLKKNDGDIRAILTTGGPFLDQVARTTQQLQPVLPPLLSDLSVLGDVLRAYLPGIEHLLIVLPALLPTFNEITDEDNPSKAYPEARLYFKLNTQPPACTSGYPMAHDIRDPSQIDPAPLPPDLYCKAPTNDPRVIRGARNDPCPNGAGRSANAAGCGLTFNTYSPSEKHGLVFGPK